MSEVKISEMTEANLAGNNDYIPIVQNGINKKITIQKLLENAGGGGTSGDTFPIGAISEWSANTIPTNWLECNGQAVSRTDYSELFTVLGTTYGEGNGSTTFNLPDYRGRVGVGKDTSQEEFDTLGKTGGEKTHELTIEEMPSHPHNIRNGNDSSNGIIALSHTAVGDQQNWAFQDVEDGPGSYGSGAFYAAPTGGSQPHNNTQPYTTTIYIIKAKQSAGVVATVEDNLESESSTNALSAKQGKRLNEKTHKDIITNGSPVKCGYKIDNKDVYVKRIDFGALPNEGQKEVSLGLLLSEIKIISDDVCAISDAGNHYSIPYIVGTGGDIYKQFILATNSLRIITESDRSNTNGYANIYFTYKN